MDAKQVSDLLTQNVLNVVSHLLPNGKKVNDNWVCGNVHGQAGKSLKVALSGKKAGLWRDFATNDKGGDLLDLWSASRNITLKAAMQEACKWLNVDYSPKLSTPHKKSFKKPVFKIDNVITPTVSDYFDKRRISAKTLKYYSVCVFKNDIAFPFIIDDEVVNVKYLTPRKTPQCKNSWRQEKNAMPCLFGWHVVNDNDQVIVITEGEIDALSVYQSGYKALSLPSGANNFEWIAYDWERLRQFKTIYLAFDNDEAGQRAIDEVLPRLGEYRCKIVNWLNFKDANECLYIEGEEGIQEKINNADFRKPKNLKNAIEYLEIIQNEFYVKDHHSDANLTPFRAMQNFSFRMSQLTVWTGYSGHGKSQLLGFCICDLIIRQNQRVCIFSGEMRTPKLLMRMIRQITGYEHPHFEKAKNALTLLSGFNENNDFNKHGFDSAESGGLWIYDIDGKVCIDRLLEVFIYAKKRFNCRHFIVDSWVMLGISETDTDKQIMVMEKIRGFKSAFNVHIHLVAHPRKPANGDESIPPNKHDVRGSVSITDLADNVLVVWRNRDKTEFTNEPDAKLICHKQRESDHEPMVNLFYEPASCQYHEFKRKRICFIDNKEIIDTKQNEFDLI